MMMMMMMMMTFDFVSEKLLDPGIPKHHENENGDAQAKQLVSKLKLLPVFAVGLNEHSVGRHIINECACVRAAGDDDMMTTNRLFMQPNSLILLDGQTYALSAAMFLSLSSCSMILP